MIRDYAGAAIYTASLTDYDIIIKAETSQVIGPHELRDVRQKYRLKRQGIQMASFEYMTLLYFDAKKTTTCGMIKNDKTIKWRLGFIPKLNLLVLSYMVQICHHG